MTFDPFQSAAQPPKMGAQPHAKGVPTPPANPRPTPGGDIPPYPYGLGTPARAGTNPLPSHFLRPDLVPMPPVSDGGVAGVGGYAVALCGPGVAR